MSSTGASREERAAGAIMGALVGDALGMGMQWYYNLSEKEEQCGEWVTEFLDPNPGRSDVFGNISKHRYDHFQPQDLFSRTLEGLLRLFGPGFFLL